MLIIRGGINSKKRELCPTALALSAFYYNKNKHADTYIMYLHAYSTSSTSSPGSRISISPNAAMMYTVTNTSNSTSQCCPFCTLFDCSTSFGQSMLSFISISHPACGLLSARCDISFYGKLPVSAVFLHLS